MTKQQRLGCTLSVAIAAFFLFVGSFLAPLNGEICQKDDYTGKKECTNHNVVFVTAWETGKFLDDHAGGITAVATALLAYITFVLMRIAREQGTTTRAQMRAYLSVVIGNGAFQDRQNGVKFAAYPRLQNNGQTPAYNVTYWSRADVIPDSLVPSYNFQVAVGNERSESTLGPGEWREINGIVPNFVADSEVDDIKSGNGKSLWIWGTVHYTDAFGSPHYTNFCQRIFWLPGDNLYGFYGPKFSTST